MSEAVETGPLEDVLPLDNSTLRHLLNDVSSAYRSLDYTIEYEKSLREQLAAIDHKRAEITGLERMIHTCVMTNQEIQTVVKQRANNRSYYERFDSQAWPKVCRRLIERLVAERGY